MLSSWEYNWTLLKILDQCGQNKEIAEKELQKRWMKSFENRIFFLFLTFPPLLPCARFLPALFAADHRILYAKGCDINKTAGQHGGGCPGLPLGGVNDRKNDASKAKEQRNIQFVADRMASQHTDK